ncbi:hypothetical protein ACFFRB_16395 [Kibdelosporangium aridum subsp. largum]
MTMPMITVTALTMTGPSGSDRVDQAAAGRFIEDHLLRCADVRGYLG